LWRRLKNPPAPHYQTFDSKQRSVFLHGAVHWIVTSEAGIRNSILKLDTTDDCFTKLSLPESLIRKDNRLFASISVFEKCLSAVCLDSSPQSTSGSIWMMKEQVTLMGRQFKFTLAASS
jgi:hypothetical protein